MTEAEAVKHVLAVELAGCDDVPWPFTSRDLGPRRQDGTSLPPGVIQSKALGPTMRSGRPPGNGRR